MDSGTAGACACARIWVKGQKTHKKSHHCYLRNSGTHHGAGSLFRHGKITFGSLWEKPLYEK